MSQKKKFSFKEAIAEIGAILGFNEIPAAADTSAADALKEYKTDSGAVLKIDKLETGGIAYMQDGVTVAAAGTYTMADGTVVTVGDAGAVLTVTLPATEAPVVDPLAAAAAAAAVPPPVTPTAAAFEAMVAKFGTGTPDERVANLEVMCKAIMQYSFGWKIDEATRKAIEEQAINAYKALGVPAQFSEQTDALAATRKELDNMTKGMRKMLEAMQQFSEAPSDDPVQIPGNAEMAPTKKEQAAAFLAVIESKEVQ